MARQRHRSGRWDGGDYIICLASLSSESLRNWIKAYHVLRLGHFQSEVGHVLPQGNPLPPGAGNPELLARLLVPSTGPLRGGGWFWTLEEPVRSGLARIDHVGVCTHGSRRDRHKDQLSAMPANIYWHILCARGKRKQVGAIPNSEKGLRVQQGSRNLGKPTYLCLWDTFSQGLLCLPV